MNSSTHQPAPTVVELEVIACSLHDAVEAQRGGASRLEVTIRLDQAGLTPPLEMVREIIQKVPLPIRVMLRDRADFSAGSEKEFQSLVRRAAEFAAATRGSPTIGYIDGFVVGHIKEGRLDLAALEKIISAAPNMRFTAHHAIEAASDPLQTLRDLREFPNVDRALVSGGTGLIAERIERLVRMREAFGPERSLISGGNLTLDMLKALLESTGIRIFHLGRAIRSPEDPSGSVDSAKVRMAAELLGLK
jgi:copper homeostasis protein